MIQLRYPNITGKTPEDRQSQMERYVRSLVDQLNFALKGSKTEESSKPGTGKTENVQVVVNGKLKEYDEELNKKLKEKFDKVWETIYPVGSVYISVSDVEPATLFGGTWEKIKDTFLLASGSTYSNGTTGGEATHTLTVNEMPSHKHTPASYDNAGSESGYKRLFTTNLSAGSSSVARQQFAAGTSRYAMAATDYTDISEDAYTSTVGGGAAHNNMPPYFAVNMWKRTA